MSPHELWQEQPSQQIRHLGFAGFAVRSLQLVWENLRCRRSPLQFWRMLKTLRRVGADSCADRFVTLASLPGLKNCYAAPFCKGTQGTQTVR